ncbi:MAG: Oxygen sensor protein DosP [Firmicutes bacterium ADurb.Bin354]|nr:MAG: Oxygen sensor protein DosP [Firmicutes bacterium ADurb.Bin354]
MMKVTFAIAAVVMSGFVLHYHIRMNRVRNSQNVIFDVMVISNAVTAVNDLVQTFFKVYLGSADYRLFYLGSFLYFCTHTLIVPFFFGYIYSNVRTWREMRKSLRCVIVAPLALAMLMVFLNPFTDWIFYYLEDGTYVRGSFLWSLYACTAIYLLGIAYVIIRFRRNFIHKKIRTIVIGVTICLIAVVLQGVYKDSSLETMAIAFTGLYFFLMLQNPRDQIDAEYPVLSRQAFGDTVRYWLVGKIRFDIVALNVPDLRKIEVRRAEDNKQEMEEIFSFLRDSAPEAELFHLSEGMFAFIIARPPQGYVDKMISRIMKRFQEPWQGFKGEEILPVKALRLRVPDEIPDEHVFNGVLNKFATVGVAGTVMGVEDFELHDIERNSKISAALVRAIDKNRLEMRYTPIWSLKKKRIVGVEVAVRFYDDEIGFVYDDEIFKYAERSGHVLRLSEMVFEGACSFYEKNLLAYRNIDMLSIRIYPSMRLQFGMMDKLMETVKAHGIETGTITLLLSEYTMSVVNDNFKGEMKKLADSGVNFCLEEYGSGYTDISSVYDLPISMIKINKSVLRAAVRNEKARVTMESTLELAHELSMKTAVSGVEDERYYNLIPDMPCDYATGNYFFEQLDEEGFRRLLEDREEAAHK